MITKTTVYCLNCQQAFEVKLSELKRNNGKYCSIKCSSISIGNIKKQKNLIIKKPNVQCSYCKKTFYLNESKKKRSKSGLYFCCREHKDISQRIGGIKQIQPPHYTSIGTDYRNIALRGKEQKCERCNYNKLIEILEVHHKDRNRDNNNISNLQILCPTCHMEEHFLKNDGRWKK